MKIESTNKIYKKDIPEAPNWVEKMLDPLNRFMDSATTALRGKLSFGDNFYCQTKEYEFTHAVEQSISFSLKSYSGTMLLKAPDSADTAKRMSSPLMVRTIDNQTLGVTAFFNGGANTTGVIKFIIVG